MSRSSADRTSPGITSMMYLLRIYHNIRVHYLQSFSCSRQLKYSLLWSKAYHMNKHIIWFFTFLLNATRTTILVGFFTTIPTAAWIPCCPATWNAIVQKKCGVTWTIMIYMTSPKDKLLEWIVNSINFHKDSLHAVQQHGNGIWRWSE